MHRNHFLSFFRFAFVILVIILSLFIVYYLSTYIYPFLIAFIIAYFINPFVNFLTYTIRLPRALSVIIAIIVLIGMFFGIITLLISEIIAGTSYLGTILPQNFNNLIMDIQNYLTNKVIPSYEHLYQNFDKLEMSQKETIIKSIQDFSSNIINIGQTILSSIFLGITNFLSSLPTIITVFIFSLLATFFISKDWYKLTSVAHKIFPEKIKFYAINIIIDLRRALFGFVRAQMTLISVTTVIVLIGLLTLNIPYAITIAVITGFVEIIPYFGTGLVFVPWIVFSYLTGDIPLAIGLLIIFLTGIIVRQLIEPKVLSSSIGLDPLPTLISIFVGVKLFGFIGLIVGPIVLVILNTLHRALIFKELWSFIIDKKN
ncbi:MAG: sporulation integral membrane protein YtvI [Bacillaceae bacterium]